MHKKEKSESKTLFQGPIDTRGKIARKAHLLLVQYGITVSHCDYSFLLDNAIAARETGLSWIRITKMIEEVA